MIKQKVLIVGASGQSKVIIDIFEKEGKYEIIGLLDANGKIEKTLGYKILGNLESLPDLLIKTPDCKVFIAIGDNWVRYQVMNQLKNLIPTIDFVSTIHPSAHIGKNVRIGKGVAIMAGAIINSDSTIGDFVIINTKASLDHDSKMLRFSSLGPNVTTGGNVAVGEFSAISIGALIKHEITIGSHSIIGAGALLLKNCGTKLIMYGVPAKKVRKREIGEKYL